MTRLGLSAFAPKRRKKTKVEQDILATFGKPQGRGVPGGYGISGVNPAVRIAPRHQPSVGLPAGTRTSLEPQAAGARRPLRGPLHVWDRPGTAVAVREGLQAGVFGEEPLNLSPAEQEQLVQRETLRNYASQARFWREGKGPWPGMLTRSPYAAPSEGRPAAGLLAQYGQGTLPAAGPKPAGAMGGAGPSDRYAAYRGRLKLRRDVAREMTTGRRQGHPLTRAQAHSIVTGKPLGEEASIQAYGLQGHLQREKARTEAYAQGAEYANTLIRGQIATAAAQADPSQAANLMREFGGGEAPGYGLPKPGLAGGALGQVLQGLADPNARQQIQTILNSELETDEKAERVGQILATYGVDPNVGRQLLAAITGKSITEVDYAHPAGISFFGGIFGQKTTPYRRE